MWECFCCLIPLVEWCHGGILWQQHNSVFIDELFWWVETWVNNVKQWFNKGSHTKEDSSKTRKGPILDVSFHSYNNDRVFVYQFKGKMMDFNLPNLLGVLFMMDPKIKIKKHIYNNIYKWLNFLHGTIRSSYPILIFFWPTMIRHMLFAGPSGQHKIIRITSFFLLKWSIIKHEKPRQQAIIQ